MGGNMNSKNLIIFDLQGTLVKNMRPPILNGSKNILEKLLLDFNLAIFTGASKTETSNILKKLMIYPLFDPQNIITKGNYQKKPNPEAIFSLIIKNKPDKTYYVGDTRKDFRTANNAEVSFIYIGKQKLGITQISSLDELLNVTIKL